MNVQENLDLVRVALISFGKKNRDEYGFRRGKRRRRKRKRKKKRKESEKKEGKKNTDKLMVT